MNTTTPTKKHGRPKKEPNSKNYTILDDKCIARAPIMDCQQPLEERAIGCSGRFAKIFTNQTHCQFCMKQNGEELPPLETTERKKHHGFS